jgi:outer membrane PBP1 activator LpoA protein
MNFTIYKRTRLRALTYSLVALLGLLAGCATTSSNLPDDPEFASVTDPDARKQLQLGRPIAAADVYTAKAAKSSTPEERQDNLLIAAEILYDRGLAEPGRERLDAVPLELATVDLVQRRNVLVAKARLLNDDPDGALEALPEPDDVATALHRARVYETLAQVYALKGDTDQELVARIGLESQLVEPIFIERSQAGIWQMLTTLPLSTLQRLTTNVRSDVYQGWVELALAHADAGAEAENRQQAFDQWQTLFPDHPATGSFVTALVTPGAFDGFSTEVGDIDTVAVLLPLTDSRAGAASAAIRDGLIAAREQASRNGTVPDLRFYDVGVNPAFARTAFETAVREGADAVIGPLRKDAVAAIITQRLIPVPTITLNTVDTSSSQSSGANVVQFGLAPEDEARAAAARAMALSLTNAIILQSDDSRGDREARAFQDSMFARGGDIVHVAVLPNDQYDYSEQIRAALAIDDSDSRFRTLSSTLGERLFFEPAIRQDVDVVFLALGNEQARSVRPQLDFFRARGIPRFATSRVAAIGQDVKVNRDLNTIYFTDAPWMLDPSLDQDPVKRAIVSQFPSASGVFGRLYALGADAWRLVSSLDVIVAGERLDGFTGQLSLGIDGRINRQLNWAQYQDGVAVPVKRVAPDDDPLAVDARNERRIN